MALIECPECDSKISDTAKSCPKCGYYPINITTKNGHADKAHTSQKSNRKYLAISSCVVLIILISFGLYRIFSIPYSEIPVGDSKLKEIVKRDFVKLDSLLMPYAIYTYTIQSDYNDGGISILSFDLSMLKWKRIYNGGEGIGGYEIQTMNLDSNTKALLYKHNYRGDSYTVLKVDQNRVNILLEGHTYDLKYSDGTITTTDDGRVDAYKWSGEKFTKVVSNAKMNITTTAGDCVLSYALINGDIKLSQNNIDIKVGKNIIMQNDGNRDEVGIQYINSELYDRPDNNYTLLIKKPGTFELMFYSNDREIEKIVTVKAHL